ncbi:hypothetical protein [Thiolapillus sp.]|nr:hypothetical protein [Thiolapillus sp.]
MRFVMRQHDLNVLNGIVATVEPQQQGLGCDLLLVWTENAQSVDLHAWSAARAENPGVKRTHRRRRNGDNTTQHWKVAVSDALQAFSSARAVEHEDAFQGNRDALLFVGFSRESVAAAARC